MADQPRDSRGRFTNKLGADWEMFKRKCANPDCDNEVFVTGPRSSSYCSRLCETNHKYLLRRNAGVEVEKQIPPEYMKRV